jgi:hypothetical protein
MQQFSGHIAIVDDDAPLREALARLLRIQGINSRSYPSARVFLEGLASGMPDCLIVDVNMPEMTGIELQCELLNRGSYPDYRNFCKRRQEHRGERRVARGRSLLRQAGAARRADGSDQFSEETALYAHAKRF